jgi:NAD-dependent DNA ligase
MAYSYDPTCNDGNPGAVVRAIEIRKIQKATEHLLGICSGLTADGHISDSEVLFLRNWISNNAEICEDWPGIVIAQRVDAILADGVITADERLDLLETLQGLTGNHFAETGTASTDAPALPIEDEPGIYFHDMTYCLTGRFLWGTRAACERAILNMGGTVVDTLTKRVDYLVIGAMIEPQWAHTTYGRKIETAMRYRADGAGILIVSEKQWTDALRDASR